MNPSPGLSLKAAVVLLLPLFCGGCDAASSANSSASGSDARPELVSNEIARSKALATFDSPWALEILPDGRFLVTQRTEPGAMYIVTPTGGVTQIAGLPDNIGVLDVTLSPDFERSRLVYFSYVAWEPDAARIGRAVDNPDMLPERMIAARGILTEAGKEARLDGVTQIFGQVPTIVSPAGNGEFGGRLTFSPDGTYLFITSGDRAEVDKKLLGRLDNNLGKTVRIFPDGRIPGDNPFVGVSKARPEIWTLGHRNPYGLVFASNGTLWSSEMGPKGGDELNIIRPGRNYGWPFVSNGDDYEGPNIPDHSPNDGFEAPRLSWTPVISPAGMLIYKGSQFEGWQGDVILTGLMSQGLLRVRIAGETAREIQRINLGVRIRDIAESADGSLWVLTDGESGGLYRITPDF